MKRYGLIGFPLGHSFSKTYFSKKFEVEGIQAIYELVPLEHKKELKHFLQQTSLDAFNVTIPWKEEMVDLLDELDETAQHLQAVNCVVRNSKGWKGFNTDCVGFEISLLDFTHLKNKKALVFGNGGSSKAVQYVLRKHQVPYLVVSRSAMQQTITYSELSPDILQDHKLWINTTPVGMFPHTEDCLPLPLHVLNKDFEVFDLIYNPEKTTLLLMAERQGARIRNGYQMLVEQAEASYHHFISAEMSL